MTFDYAEFSAAFPWFFPVVAGVFGAIVGSFLNVVIYRMPLDKSVVTPGSHCACGAPIKWYDNIPVLSWFILRGKARCCGQKRILTDILTRASAINLARLATLGLRHAPTGWAIA